MDDDWRSRRRPAQPAISPFVQRIGILLLAFVLLLPVARLIDRGDQQTVKVTALPGASVGAVTEAPTTTVVAPAVTVAPVPETTAAPVTVAAPQTVATTAAKAKPPAVAKQPAAKKPATTAAKKPATTAKKPVTTAAKKPAATTAAKKPVATTAKPKPPAATAPKPAPAPAPAPSATYTAAQVEQIIRDIWPDELEDRALAIAKRESRLIPTSRNYCCYGLFAIYYEAGKRLLNSIGVMSADQLLDPYVNTRAAVAIYQAAGWDPWKL